MFAKNLRAALLAGALSLTALSAAAEAPGIDVRSPADFDVSARAMAESLPAEEQRHFGLAIAAVLLSQGPVLVEETMKLYQQEMSSHEREAKQAQIFPRLLAPMEGMDAQTVMALGDALMEQMGVTLDEFEGLLLAAGQDIPLEDLGMEDLAPKSRFDERMDESEHGLPEPPAIFR